MASVNECGPYQVLVPLAAGGMGEVFAAVSPSGDLVAIKKILAHRLEDPELIHLFEREARLSQRVNHTNVVRTIAVNKEGDDHYMVMELHPHATLAHVFTDALRADSGFAVDCLTEIAAQAFDGLSAIHQAKDADGKDLGIVHRDISPQNVLVGTNGIVKIADFGVAKATSRLTSTVAGGVKGKFAYMSPEQLNGDAVDARSDIYSLGVACWEAFSGERLHANTPADLSLLERIDKVSAGDLRDHNPDIPAPVAEVIAQCLCKDPSTRPSDAANVAIRLRAGLTEPVSAEKIASELTRVCGRRLRGSLSRIDDAFAALETTAGHEPQRPRGELRRKRVWVAAAAVALLVGGLAAWTVPKFTDQATPAQPATRHEHTTAAASTPAANRELFAPAELRALEKGEDEGEPTNKEGAQSLSGAEADVAEDPPAAETDTRSADRAPRARRRPRASRRRARQERTEASKRDTKTSSGDPQPKEKKSTLLGGLDEFGR